jgi:uncharacterized DUF497 family protein
MGEYNFKWDESKRNVNIRKHGIDFSDVVNIFYDDETIIIEDPKQYNERRYIALGLDIKCRTVLVVHVYREIDVIRVISARKANKKERKQFVGEL